MGQTALERALEAVSRGADICVTRERIDAPTWRVTWLNEPVILEAADFEDVPEAMQEVELGAAEGAHVVREIERRQNIVSPTELTIDRGLVMITRFRNGIGSGQVLHLKVTPPAAGQTVEVVVPIHSWEADAIGNAGPTRQRAEMVHAVIRRARLWRDRLIIGTPSWDLDAHAEIPG